MTMPSAEFYRLDPLTGCNNFLSFVETLDHLSSMDERQQFAILYTDLNYFQMVNETKGHAYGDTVIRWLGIVLQEEGNSPTYRTGGDEFAVILTDGFHADYEELLNRIFARLNREGEQLGIVSPPAKIALIHFDTDHDFSINDVMFHLGETIRDVKKNKDGTIKIFQARELIKSTAKVDEQSLDTISRSWEVLQSIANQSINRVLLMGRVLDIAQKNSFLDSISGLPNMRAALLIMEKELASKQLFSILIMDGDNLRRYNNISYAAGDEMIQKIGEVLSEKLRPGDFVARWRTGDEFIVILPNTSGEGARIVGERFCAAIREASKAWKFPTSISIGVAIYPKHGDNINALVDVAEMANKQAKEEGKDRVILAE
jgi:diguanylate cyclase (GGDEF)-like protein